MICRYTALVTGFFSYWNLSNISDVGVISILLYFGQYLPPFFNEVSITFTGYAILLFTEYSVPFPYKYRSMLHFRHWTGGVPFLEWQPDNFSSYPEPAKITFFRCLTPKTGIGNCFLTNWARYIRIGLWVGGRHNHFTDSTGCLSVACSCLWYTNSLRIVVQIIWTSRSIILNISCG